MCHRDSFQKKFYSNNKKPLTEADTKRALNFHICFKTCGILHKENCEGGKLHSLDMIMALQIRPSVLVFCLDPSA